jgi:DNA-binding transcriptional MerR regulator
MNTIGIGQLAKQSGVPIDTVRHCDILNALSQDSDQ